MNMDKEFSLAKKIIARIRNHAEWTPNHAHINFGDVSIGYYDTTGKDDYFVLKYGNIEFTHHNAANSYAIDFKDISIYDFSLLEWLEKLAEITSIPNEIIIKGVRYIRA